MSAFIRSATLTNYVDLARSVGLDPYRMLAMVALPPSCLGHADLRIPADAVLHLLELSAQISGEEAFGLRLAETRRLSTLGLLGMLARDEPTLRHALAALLRYSRLHNEALVVEFEEDEGIVVLHERILPSRHSGRQSIELAVGAMHRILRIFLGNDWTARMVSFMHPPPRHMGVHRRVLGPHVNFSQDFNGIVLTSADLDTPVAFSDPVMARYARQLLDTTPDSADAQTAHEVQQLILALLPSGRCTIEQVARHLGVDRRTVHRRLTREGLTFSALLDQTRVELVRGHLQNGNRTLTEVSGLLGFSCLSAFSRWRRQQAGQLSLAPIAKAVLHQRPEA